VTSEPLSSQVADLCQDLGGRVEGHTRTMVLDVLRRLGEPLRLVIAGRRKAGKSTLANALVGRRVAPTGVGDSTRVVTQLRYGTSDRVDVVRHNGTRVSLPLDRHGMIPQRLGVPVEDIAYVDVTLPSVHLRDLTIVDTPGRASADKAEPAHARRIPADRAPLGDNLDEDSARALSGSEALIYVFTQAVRPDDARALEAFREMAALVPHHTNNSLGVFSKVDLLAGGGADPWPVAEALATDQAKILRRFVIDVVPLVGLLGETAETGRLTDADCEALRQLAALPTPERQILLASVDLFLARESVVSCEARERLPPMLGVYGISFATAMLVERPHISTRELVRLLQQASGFMRLRQTLDQRFRNRRDVIKANWGLSALEKIAGHAERPQDQDIMREATRRFKATRRFERPPDFG
jgi:hypothetical protein